LYIYVYITMLTVACRNPLYLLEGTALAEIQRDSQINADVSLPHDVVVIGLSPSNFNYEKVRAMRKRMVTI
jgi:hypothetical protein